MLPQFNAIRAANYNPLRAKIFYYMIWANGYDGGTSSGNAFAIPNDQFVVTLGAFPSQGTPDAKVGTFIHEFGHDLGLLHGGDENKNYKPNYLSVMSYAHQINGRAEDRSAGSVLRVLGGRPAGPRRDDAQRERRPQQRRGEHLPDPVVVPGRHW